VVGVIRTDSRAPRESPEPAAEFVAQAEALRKELFAHCYRMVGSVHEAEDLVQETYLRAWHALDSFERRSSMRTWLYRIATNTCLNAVEAARRRALPVQLWPASDPADAVAEPTDVAWVEPLPTTGAAVGPEDAAVERESLRLAFVAVLQTLPPRQRAILLLRDVLRFSAAESAQMLDTTAVAVNSGLRRARDQLAARVQTPAEPAEPELRRRLDQYVAAWEAKDVPAIVALFSADVIWEMPPLSAWYRGRADIAHHLAERCPVRPGQARLVPIRANGQPAFATYTREPDGSQRRAFLQVLDIGPGGIEHVYAFGDPAVFALFGLP
jgi:RNA polymerase sigma-70 factor (ECF subfamily)